MVTDWFDLINVDRVYGQRDVPACTDKIRPISLGAPALSVLDGHSSNLAAWMRLDSQR